ncbi:unnamed protein product [Microthlaspi erraticum]|uniref:Uncharacterized protein n=1 Tax=Microthlaspi erraticum TaxID=1685480 RepID=A0A6D2KGQ1_9BRAS|nr:unnamed protein product [Microthlaspi erraticum]CAA7051472.1 unnamed protein product [Microthlaspi erraticum]
MTVCNNREKAGLKERPESANADAAEVFQFLQITKPVTVTLGLAQVKDVHTAICSIQRPFPCVRLRRWTIQIDTHLWHRWKTKIGILQIVSELVLPKVDIFQVTKWIVLLNSSLRSSFISTEGVYMRISTSLLIVEVLNWLLSTASKFDIFERKA